MKRKMSRLLCAALAAGMCLTGAAEKKLNSGRVMQIEETLSELGYHDEQFDALMDSRTRAALYSFQLANGLTPTGMADSETLALLDSGDCVTCHEYLVNMAVEYADAPIFQTGSSGEEVQRIQMKLRELGYFRGSCDGAFGEETTLAVKQFQMANGLSETGIADRSTQLRLQVVQPISWQDFQKNAVCSYGDIGTHVRQIQKMLKKMGYFAGDCTGSFGEMTQEAVREFQMNNNLEQTGSMDIDSIRLIFSDRAVSRSDPQTLRVGDYEDAVASLQSKLAAHGYFDRNITGIFGATTETAVRLFQIANALPATGAANQAMLDLLDSGAAVRMEDARDMFSGQLRSQDESAQAVIASVAMELRGQSFEADDEDLYEGFAFVQYVCVAAGIPVVSPEDVIGLISDRVESYDEMQPGDILAFKEGDGSRVLLAVSAGGERVVYATPDSSWVLESDLSRMGEADLYRWNMGTDVE